MSTGARVNMIPLLGIVGGFGLSFPWGRPAVDRSAVAFGRRLGREGPLTKAWTKVMGGAAAA